MKAESRKQKAERGKQKAPAENSGGFGIGLQTGLQSPVFTSLDRQFASFIHRLAGGNELVGLGAAVASWQSREGNVCADLRSLAGTTPERSGEGRTTQRLPEYAEWSAALRGSPVVGSPGAFTPLVFDEAGRLYLHRLWDDERALAADIVRRVASEVAGVDWAVFRAGAERFFPPAKSGEIQWQKVACFAAMRRRLCVISGGPGTGKTWTAGVLLALLIEQPGAEKLRIGLAAPTGKAAVRLQESVAALAAKLPLSEPARARLPAEASTLHRLLGLRQDSARARHDAAHPLPLDVVIVDEASMVDVTLMAKLFAAVPPAARIVLLGDKDQLASVESGAVLRDICGAGQGNGFSSGFVRDCERVFGGKIPAAAAGSAMSSVTDCVVRLERNYRFGSTAPLLELSRTVNAGDAARATQLLAEEPGLRAVARRELSEAARLKESLRPLVREKFAPVVNAANPAEALKALGRFRILCAVRGGPFGVESVNALVGEILAEEDFPAGAGAPHRGCPVLVTENDYDARLFNGDLGVLWPAGASGPLMAHFAEPGGATRALAPARLPRHETAFAMTVHKSQGSEFESVLLLLPERDSPVLTRELIYTGLTRAGRAVEVWSPEGILREGITRRIARASGLAEKLQSAEVTGNIVKSLL